MPSFAPDRTSFLKGVGAPVVALTIAIGFAAYVVTGIGDRTVSSLDAAGMVLVIGARSSRHRTRDRICVGNDATNGGGGTLRCSVAVTNTFVGVSATPTAVTINQCVGSGDGFTTGCDPFPATTSGATITQCNGSANGGTLVGLTCTASGTQAAAHSVTINQCNGSTNGGGGLVICSANITNAALAATPTPAPTAPSSTGAPTTSLTPTASGGSTTADAPTTSPGLPDTSTIGTGRAADARGVTLLVAGLLLVALLLLGMPSTRRNT